MVGRSAPALARWSMVVAGSVCLSLLAVPPAASADEGPMLPTPWETVASPNAGSATGRFSAVACASDLDCWAVGNSLPGTATSAAIAHWMGGAWTMEPVPPLPGLLTYMFGAACAAPDECFAVGMAANVADFFAGRVPWPYFHAVAYHWDGAAWSVDEMTFGDPMTERAVLRSVACSGPGDCWAVGFLNDGAAHTLMLHWDGVAWTRAPLSPALDDANLELGALSCPAVDFCMAVGPVLDHFVVPAARSPTAALWDGTTWSLAPSPAGQGTLDSATVAYDAWINGVACTSATDCWAVGDADTGMLVDGDGEPIGPSLPLVQHWDGTAWTATVLPPPLAGTAHHVDDVACVSASDCWAVGHIDGDAVANGVLVEALRRDYLLHYDGQAWLPGPALDDPLATAAGDLASVACPSPTRCWAVGQVSPAGQPHELLQGYDGTAWSSAPAPTADAVVGNYVRDVECLAEDDCWAVGSYQYGQLGRTLVQHWDGSTWSVVESPNTGDDRSNVLDGVSCSSATDCWAVGSTHTWDIQHVQPLALHWDGDSWNLAPPLPLPVDRVSTAFNGAQPAAYVVQEASLEAVHCVAADDCWAVGTLVAAANQAGSWIVGATLNAKSLFLHWDGSAWTPTPGPATQAEYLTEYMLQDITCASASDCTAVGSKFARLQYNFLGDRDAQTLVDHWDGRAWTEVATPNVGPHTNQLHSVSCVGGSCWAVGMAYLDYAYSGTPRIVPLALRGTSGLWHLDSLSDTGTGWLGGVSCSSPADCWAVGSGFTSWYDPQESLALHWDGLTWASAAVPSVANVPGKPADNTLVAVTCAVGPDCWAVGGHAWGPNRQSLALHAQGGGCLALPASACGPAASVMRACAPHRSSTPQNLDKDRDGVPALYFRRHTEYTVGDDGSVSQRARSGDCWITGDSDDDGPTRVPAAGPTQTATTCVVWDANVGTQDRDHDGAPALYAFRGEKVTVESDGSLVWGRTRERCWLAGDLDDDDGQRVPASPFPVESAAACLTWDGDVVAQDRDGDGLPAAYASGGETLAVGADGSTTWSGQGHDCRLAGDPDDDGSPLALPPVFG